MKPKKSMSRDEFITWAEHHVTDTDAMHERRMMKLEKRVFAFDPTAARLFSKCREAEIELEMYLRNTYPELG